MKSCYSCPHLTTAQQKTTEKQKWVSYVSNENESHFELQFNAPTWQIFPQKFAEVKIKFVWLLEKISTVVP